MRRAAADSTKPWCIHPPVPPHTHPDPPPLQSDALGAIRGQPAEPLLSCSRLAQVAASVLVALETLHGAGFAHLDIKPANLLRTAAGRLMVGDAGCMQRVSPDGQLHSPASGTPLFAAPETKRRGAFSVKADLYSVGVTLAVCAAWHRQTGRVLAFLRGEVALPDYVPLELRDLVARLVAADPEERPTAAEALAHPFLAGVDLAALAPVRGEGTVPR
jgi:serine/threonine protein kinase